MELADRYTDKEVGADRKAVKRAARKLRADARAPQRRRATTPGDIPKSGWKEIFWRIKGQLSTNHVGLVAAGCAFYGLLAVFPAITALMAIAGLVLEPDQVVGALQGVSSLVPEDVAQILLGQASEVAGSQTGGLTLGLILGVGLALWSASAGVGALMQGLNVAYGETERRGLVKLKALTLLLTLGMIVGVIVAAALIIALPIVLDFVTFAPWVGSVIGVARFLPLALLFLVGLAILYRHGPDREDAQLAWITPGAALAMTLWIAMSIGFSLYVANFASYNETFGSLAGVIVLLTWMWLSAFIVLVGAQANAEMEAQTAYDTTTGARQPMGSRGAVKADELGAPR